MYLHILGCRLLIFNPDVTPTDRIDIDPSGFIVYPGQGSRRVLHIIYRAYVCVKQCIKGISEWPSSGPLYYYYYYYYTRRIAYCPSSVFRILRDHIFSVRANLTCARVNYYYDIDVTGRRLYINNNRTRLLSLVLSNNNSNTAHNWLGSLLHWSASRIVYIYFFY